MDLQLHEAFLCSLPRILELFVRGVCCSGNRAKLVIECNCITYGTPVIEVYFLED